MLYLNSAHVREANLCWDDLIGVIRETVCELGRKDFSQPIKPYLRFGDPRNRIIAMPAYIGGRSAMAGLKWIASFPGNIEKGLPRASSVTILNDPDTGVPLCIINTALISALRTAAVSGLVLQSWFREGRKLAIGIVGFGPVGKTHLAMAESVLGDSIGKVRIFDLKPIDKKSLEGCCKDKIEVCGSWQECFVGSDVVITCTVSTAPYIRMEPKKGSLHLNVSLRDYQVSMRQYMNMIIVDDWDEVCRQNTDIENMHKQGLLKKEETYSISELVGSGLFDTIGADDVVMFNPMGMAVFDIAIGTYYYRQAVSKGFGIAVPE